MSSTLYQLSYSLFRETIEFVLTDAPYHRNKKVDPHNSQKMRNVTQSTVGTISSPPPGYCRLGGIRTRDPSIARAVSYHLTTNPVLLAASPSYVVRKLG